MSQAEIKQLEERIDALRLQLINVKKELNEIEIKLEKAKLEELK